VRRGPAGCGDPTKDRGQAGVAIHKAGLAQGTMGSSIAKAKAPHRERLDRAGNRRGLEDNRAKERRWNPAVF
jgi:hypothetical protein